MSDEPKVKGLVFRSVLDTLVIVRGEPFRAEVEAGLDGDLGDDHEDREACLSALLRHRSACSGRSAEWR